MKNNKTIIGQVLNFFNSTQEKISENFNEAEEQISPTDVQSRNGVGLDYSPWYPMNATVAFDGEKTQGELGMPVHVVPIYKALRMRAYEAELKTDVVKIITGRFFKWVIGTGLKLQAEPNETVLKTEGISDLLNDFISNSEARFQVYAESTISDFNGMANLHERAADAFRTSFLGGDCLVIMRIENSFPNVQIIDGQEIVNPDKEQFHKDAEAAGNYIQDGIEINKKGEHVAFFVRMQEADQIEIKRVAAKGEKTGRVFAWMLYGTKHRINHHRGIPQISAILEKVNKLDRYTEASVSSAEERAKIVYAIEHNQFSTGENPVLENLKKNLGGGKGIEDAFQLAEGVTKNIKLTTNKQAFNMPVGSKLSVLDSNQELQYDAFFKGVFVQLCAAVDIPPEVALQQYDSNYSASRAAINGWGYIVDIYRKKFTTNFYKKVYSLWLETEILKGKLIAPGYLKALKENNIMALESYSACRFTGINMPHIDPLKEVKAIREMLGDPANGIPPLIGLDRATELLNQGDWSENFKKYLEEIKKLEALPKPKENDTQTENQNLVK